MPDTDGHPGTPPASRPNPAGGLTFAIPISAADATAWVTGLRDDLYLLLHASLVPEGVFAGHLPPGRAALRDMLGRIAYWRRRGARFMVARAEGVIIQHYFKVGALPILKETYPDQVKYRFLLPPEVFDRWAGKFCKCPAPLPPCQHPTHPAKAAHIES